MKGDDDDYSDILQGRVLSDLVGFYMGTFIVLREFNQGVSNMISEKPFGYSGPSGMKIVNDFTKLGEQIGQREIDKGFVKASTVFLSDILGLPSVALGRVIDAAYAGDSDWYNYFIGYSNK